MRTLTLCLMFLLALTGRAEDPVELQATLDNEPVTVTFAFNLGTTGQKADFGEGAPFFINSKVNWGSNLEFYGLDANNIGQTLFMPIEQQNETEGGTAADESNAIRFLFQPRFGYTFTPTKVSLKTTRFGTDNGLLDIAWENPDKTTVLLEQGVKPNRNNENPNVSELSYEVTGATPGEGTCGLLINLYHLQNGKQVGFSDIVIEGTLTGTEREVPVLASLTINGKEYTVEELFDDAYEAELELSKKSPISKIKPRECPLIKFKGCSFFFFVDKIHWLCRNGRPCFRYYWCAVHLSPLLVLDLISTWSNRIYSPPDSRGRLARACRSSLATVCKSVISSSAACRYASA